MKHLNITSFIHNVAVNFALLAIIIFSSIYSIFVPVRPLSAQELCEETQRALNIGALHLDACEVKDQCTPSTGDATAGLIIPAEGENKERAYQAMVGAGLTPKQAAGIVGNLMAESSENIDPTIVSPAGYRGIAQWDTSRWANLLDWAAENGKDELSFEAQLEFMWEEATERGQIEGIKQYDDIAYTAWYWGRFYEGAVIGGSLSETPLTNVQALNERTEFANTVWEDYRTITSVTTGRPAVVALDPGHGGAVDFYTDPVTGLRDRETTNSPEREQVLDVAERVKTDLESSGYRVILLRTEAQQAISKRDRVDAAVAADADLAVSIHTTPGVINEVWPQHVGGYRETPDGTRVTFENQSVAALSQRYAEAIAQARTTSEGHTVNVTTSTFRGGDHAPGDLTHVQLWSENTPWVYNEIEQNSPGSGITDQRIQDYADGIANGIELALPSTSSGLVDCEPQAGDVVATALLYSWPEYKGRGFVEKKTEYAEAVQNARAQGRYVGGINHPGVDCGGFVTTVMLDSGFEPEYNFDGKGGFTGYQLEWVRDNWTRIGQISSTSELRPGDVAFQVQSDGYNDRHTFMYVGNNNNFETEIASSSLDNRAPMAGRERPVANNIEWYRKR